jgi:hypothetical protein
VPDGLDAGHIDHAKADGDQQPRQGGQGYCPSGLGMLPLTPAACTRAMMAMVRAGSSMSNTQVRPYHYAVVVACPGGQSRGTDLCVCPLQLSL